MADEAVVHIGENSPEQVAYRLMREILLNVESKDYSDLDREAYLNTYAECLYTVQHPRTRIKH